MSGNFKYSLIYACKKNQYFWLVLGGCPRSGTTMLNFALNSHPQIFLANEQNLFKTISISDRLFFREDHVKNRIPRELSIREKIINDDEHEKRMKATIQRKLSQVSVITSLFESSLIGDNIPNGIVYLGDKFPKYYRWNLKEIEKICQSVKYIHITRSPIYNINSNLFRQEMAKQGKDWRKHSSASVYDYMKEWILAWNFICKNCEQTNFLHLRYEDIIAAPETEFKKIGEFLDIQPIFNTSKIMATPQDRDYISDYNMAIIEKYIPQELIDWQLPLDELVQKYPQLGLDFMSSKTSRVIKKSIPVFLKVFYKKLFGK